MRVHEREFRGRDGAGREEREEYYLKVNNRNKLLSLKKRIMIRVYIHKKNFKEEEIKR